MKQHVINTHCDSQVAIQFVAKQVTYNSMKHNKD